MISTLEPFLARHADLIRVRIDRAEGSAPRAAGTEMLVAETGLYGTIGGGQLEYMAIDTARAMLRSGAMAQEMTVPLGPEIGQCCGGRVEIRLTRMGARDRVAAERTEAREIAARPHLYIFGAGHVGRALARVAQFLPLNSMVIDGRAEELSLVEAEVEIRASALSEAEIRNARPHSAFVIATHDHALDFMLTSEALSRGDAAYVGMIGSATKRTKFERFHGAKNIRQLTCPIGVSAGDKRPAVIATCVAAEVMLHLARVPAPVSE